MKNLIVIIIFSAVAHFTDAQYQVSLHLSQRLGDQPFQYNTTLQLANNYFIKVSRLQYYIAEIKLIHDGGQVTPVSDVYFLVAPYRDSILQLGTFDNITDLEKIEFSIGVDQAHNHLDPASYPASHPLSPKNPTMHWGWTSGYRFIAFEGNAGSDGTNFPNNYQIHTVDDSNYRTITLEVEEQTNGNEMTIPVKANYEHLFDGINVAGGLISHAATGASKTLINNMRDFVFTAALSSLVIDPDVKGYVAISPNPSDGQFEIKYDLSGMTALALTIVDVRGGVVYADKLSNDCGTLQVHVNFPEGLYFAMIRQDQRILAMEKLVVK